MDSEPVVLEERNRCAALVERHRKGLLNRATDSLLVRILNDIRSGVIPPKDAPPGPSADDADRQQFDR
ncbi:hypothetical protein V7x_28880 [Crateriforma conspicua]|uniref:Uncharacterized protein n=1 Tax=Crateriforma conspicua TaxID=2527996 RepID=A0A5C6FY95_9PLAN|nr:hypothetical protein V7x_28880 [Crateriforma conspicua]